MLLVDIFFCKLGILVFWVITVFVLWQSHNDNSLPALNVLLQQNYQIRAVEFKVFVPECYNSIWAWCFVILHVTKSIF